MVWAKITSLIFIKLKKKSVLVLYFHLLVGYNRYGSLYCPFCSVKCAIALR
jgi:hypothetical protein